MEIKEIKNIEKFVDFGYLISKRNPNWIMDFRKNQINILSESHPFWKKAEKKLFAVYENGKIIGKIAAMINHYYNEFHGEKSAFFGFFDCEDNKEAAKILFESSANWARERGCFLMRGPANPSSNYTWGLLIENFDEPNVIMMPYNPPYYISLIEDCGYYKEKDLYAFKWIYNKEILDKFNPTIDRIKKENSDIAIDFADIDNLKNVFEDFKSVYNRAWEKNWGFVPMTDEEIENMAGELKAIIKREYIFFAKKNNIPVAFCLMLPDFNIALKALKESFIPLNFLKFFYNYLFKIKSGRMLALGVNLEYRGRGIEVLMILKAIEISKKLNWEWGDLSWTLEDNIKINKTIEKFGGRIYKKYRIYRKEL